MTALTHWALEDGNWVVLKIPRATDFTEYGSSVLWDPSGSYIQPEVAIDLLLEFRQLNAEKLKEIPVNLSLYGKYNIAGMHDVHDKPYTPLPAQHKWIDSE
jgi:small subunit ribosomal protein S29